MNESLESCPVLPGPMSYGGGTPAPQAYVMLNIMLRDRNEIEATRIEYSQRVE